jgi:hypothetical protein
MSARQENGGSARETFRIKKLEVFSAIVVAVIAASSGWIVALKPLFNTESTNTLVGRIDGHWEIIANGYIFDMCILQDQTNKIHGGMFLREGPPTSTCENLHDSTDPFRGDFNPATGEISFTRDPDTNEAQPHAGTIVKIKSSDVGRGTFTYARTPGQDAQFVMMRLDP